MSKRRSASLRWAAGGLMVTGLFAKLLGVVRQILIAGYFGTSAELDAVFLGVAIPMAITVGAGGGFSRAVVPIASGMEITRFTGLMRDGFRRIVMIFGGLMLTMAVVLTLGALAWVGFFESGKQVVDKNGFLISITVGSLTLLGGTLAGFSVGLMNARGSHVSASLNPIAHNTTVIVSVLLLHHWLGALSVLVGIVLAEWMQLAVQWPFLWRMTEYVVPRPREGDWQKLKALFWPSAIIGVTTGLNIAIDRVFATKLPEGSISALTYADALMNLPVGLLGSALAVPLFTQLSEHFNQGRKKDFERTIVLGIRRFLYVGIPMAILLTALCEPIIGLLFDRGKFTGNSVHLSSIAMRGYAVGIAFQALTALMISAGMACKRPWTVVTVMLATTGLNAVLDYYFVQWAGLFGIAVATSVVVAVRVFAIVLFVFPRALIHTPIWGTLIRSTLYALMLAIPLALLAYCIQVFSLDSIVWRVVVLAIGALVCLPITVAAWRPLLRHDWRSLGLESVLESVFSKLRAIPFVRYLVPKAPRGTEES